MEMITVEGIYDYLMYVGKCSLYSQSNHAAVKNIFLIFFMHTVFFTTKYN